MWPPGGAVCSSWTSGVTGRSAGTLACRTSRAQEPRRHEPVNHIRGEAGRLGPVGLKRNGAYSMNDQQPPIRALGAHEAASAPWVVEFESNLQTMEKEQQAELRWLRDTMGAANILVAQGGMTVLLIPLFWGMFSDTCPYSVPLGGSGPCTTRQILWIIAADTLLVVPYAALMWCITLILSIVLTAAGRLVEARL